MKDLAFGPDSNDMSIESDYYNFKIENMETNNLTPNDIDNPLVLNWTGLHYKVNKPFDQSGEYVYKSIASSLLEENKRLKENLERLIDRVEEGGFQLNFPSAYNRAKQCLNETKA